MENIGLKYLIESEIPTGNFEEISKNIQFTLGNKQWQLVQMILGRLQVVYFDVPQNKEDPHN